MSHVILPFADCDSAETVLSPIFEAYNLTGFYFKEDQSDGTHKWIVEGSVTDLMDFLSSHYFEGEDSDQIPSTDEMLDMIVFGG